MTLRTHRRICWAVIAVSVVYLTGWAAVELREYHMAKSIKTLCAEAREAERTGDYPRTFELCKSIQKKDPAAAAAIRGKAYEDQDKLDEASVEYQAAYDLNDHVASVSLMRVKRKLKARAK